MGPPIVQPFLGADLHHGDSFTVYVTIDPICYTDALSGVGLLTLRMSCPGLGHCRIARWVRLRPAYDVAGRMRPLPSNLWILDDGQTAQHLRDLSIESSWARVDPLAWEIFLYDVESYYAELLLSLHRATRDSEDWERVVAALLAHEHRVFRVD